MLGMVTPPGVWRIRLEDDALARDTATAIRSSRKLRLHVAALRKPMASPEPLDAHASERLHEEIASEATLRCLPLYPILRFDAPPNHALKGLFHCQKMLRRRRSTSRVI